MPASDKYCKFFLHAALNGNKTEAAKHNVYDDVVYIEIFIKGNTNTSFSRPKKDEDEQEFPKEWKAYLTQTNIEDNGTPLNALPTLGPSMQMNLNAQGIRTIEDLAELSDSVVIGEQGMVDLRKRAVAYLAAMAPEEDVPQEPKKRTRRKRNKETGELE